MQALNDIIIINNNNKNNSNSNSGGSNNCTKSCFIARNPCKTRSGRKWRKKEKQKRNENKFFLSVIQSVFQYLRAAAVPAVALNLFNFILKFPSFLLFFFHKHITNPACCTYHSHIHIVANNKCGCSFNAFHFISFHFFYFRFSIFNFY